MSGDLGVQAAASYFWAVLSYPMPIRAPQAFRRVQNQLSLYYTWVPNSCPTKYTFVRLVVYRNKPPQTVKISF